VIQLFSFPSAKVQLRRVFRRFLFDSVTFSCYSPSHVSRSSHNFTQTNPEQQMLHQPIKTTIDYLGIDVKPRQS